jgi:hypothetical protein
MPGFTFEQVRLAGQHPDTRLQFVFRSERHADCLFGWEADLWHDDEDEWDEPDGEDPGLPDPESYAGEILIALMENLEAAGYGVPDECDPDPEGITWMRNPYGDKPSWDWDFADRVEYALRQYVASARPVSRETVRRLLETGVDSPEALVQIVTSDRSDELALPHYGCWESSVGVLRWRLFWSAFETLGHGIVCGQSPSSAYWPHVSTGLSFSAPSLPKQMTRCGRSSWERCTSAVLPHGTWLLPCSVTIPSPRQFGRRQLGLSVAPVSASRRPPQRWSPPSGTIIPTSSWAPWKGWPYLSPRGPKIWQPSLCTTAE